MRALIVLSFILAPATAGAQEWRAMLSPGPVAKDHQPTEGNCDACHLVFKGVPNEKCLKCHSPLAERIARGQSFHAGVKSDACIKCHVDHQGRDASLTTDAARKGFDHRLTGFPLENEHGKLACNDCHKGSIGKMAAKCGSCHEDPHRTKLGAECQQCHGSLSWKSLLKSKVDHQVPMSGGHENLDCTGCHDGGANLKKEVGCESCHTQGHGGTDAPCNDCHQVSGWKPAKFDHSFCTCKFPGKHRTFSCLGCHIDFTFSGTTELCSGCHLKQLPHDPIGECSLCHSALSWKNNLFDHNKRSQFKLTDLHLTVNCERCHTQEKNGKTQFRDAPTDCKGCHAKAGEAAHGDFGDCAKCHDTKGFDKSTFDHASTGFPITGQHEVLGCRDCHDQKVRGFPKSKTEKTEKSSASNDWRTIGILIAAAQPHAAEVSGCQHCHEDPHAGQGGDRCQTCHLTENWTPTTFTLERHQATKFPLKGKHTEASCDACHVGGQLAGLPLECADCHVDRHQGKFGRRCIDCHSEVGFKPVPGFDHQTTGFALVGRHEKVKCDACHEGANGKRMFDAKDKRACSTCHVPSHSAELGTCAKCHSELQPFREARGAFDHRLTTFPLERRHSVLACKTCHAPGTSKLIARCDQCHLEPHLGQLGTTCESCHRPDRWSLARFDHDAAGWPLRGRHHVTACADCHTAQRWFGLTTACFDCHALDAARGAMIAPAQHPFGPLECGDCHFSGFTWKM